MSFRRFILLALTLMLGLTSPVMAVMRASADATVQTVLCVGTQVVTVHTDAKGKPTVAPHICPECALNDGLVGHVPLAVVPCKMVLVGLSQGTVPLVIGADGIVMPRTRAPPTFA